MTDAKAAVLEVRNLNSGYGSKQVVRDVSFGLEAGQIVALVGHNGAGKTTLLKTLIGVIAARSGNVVFDGWDITRLPTARRVSQGLRLLPEGRGIFPDLTVAENIDVIEACNPGAAADAFGRKDIFEFFPVLVEKLEVRAGSMSGGQQQLLALGLAMMGSPRCLLLDEPSIGIAPNLVEALFKRVRAICDHRGMAALLVEQNVAAAMKVADRVIILNGGRVVFNGLSSEASGSTFWKHF
ncbi:MAG TPA: ABC transporter ATP-binding protein [Magnetospirillaceae bacterium]|jgi:branched-chain amino acid transport system ATP-binding protein